MSNFYGSIKEAVKCLKKHAGRDASKFVIVEVSEGQFDIHHKNFPDTTKKVVLDGATL